MAIGDVAMHKIDFIGHRIKIGLVASVGECIQHAYLVILAVAQGVVHEIGTNKAGSTGHKHLHNSNDTRLAPELGGCLAGASMEYNKRMCGIIGYIGKGEAMPVLLDGLRRMEYRGYDSAGVA